MDADGLALDILIRERRNRHLVHGAPTPPILALLDAVDCGHALSLYLPNEQTTY